MQATTAVAIPPNPMVEMFLAQNPTLMPHAIAHLRSLSVDEQIMVIGRGSLMSARDPTAMLLGRIRAAKMGALSKPANWSELQERATGERFPELQGMQGMPGKAKRSRSRSSSSSSSRSKKKEKAETQETQVFIQQQH